MTLEVVKKAEVALKHGITVLPFFFSFCILRAARVHRACNFLFSESPIFLQLQALCPTACDSVLQIAIVQWGEWWLELKNCCLVSIQIQVVRYMNGLFESSCE